MCTFTDDILYSLYCVYVYFILICFVCTSVRTIARDENLIAVSNNKIIIIIIEKEKKSEYGMDWRPESF